VDFMSGLMRNKLLESRVYFVSKDSGSAAGGRSGRHSQENKNLRTGEGIRGVMSRSRHDIVGHSANYAVDLVQKDKMF